MSKKKELPKTENITRNDHPRRPAMTMNMKLMDIFVSFSSSSSSSTYFDSITIVNNKFSEFFLHVKSMNGFVVEGDESFPAMRK